MGLSFIDVVDLVTLQDLMMTGLKGFMIKYDQFLPTEFDRLIQVPRFSRMMEGVITKAMSRVSEDAIANVSIDMSQMFLDQRWIDPTGGLD